jgi:thiamine biosynthesis lipoprotein
MLHRLEFHAMGCQMLAAIDHDDKPTTLPNVPQWFEEWEQILSRFRYDSELTQLNQIHEQPVHVSKTLWDVLQIARQAEQMTNGLVTPSLLDALIEAGYDRPFDVLPHHVQYKPDPVITASLPLTMMVLDEAARTVTLPFGMSLDFGGSAKGWCAYQAMQRLQAEGPALVNAGGDIAISGPRPDGSKWQIGITNPFRPGEEIETLFLNACGVATSGKDRRRWTRGRVLQHHIIDPLTSQSAQTDLLTVTVVAPNVMQAEAAAKAAFILGSRAGMAWIEAHPNLAALFILDDGHVVYSCKMENVL